MTKHQHHRVSRSRGFSLIEVVLAIGIFLVTVLALVGLLGPTLQSVDEVEKTDEVSSVVNTINAFLQNSPLIAAGTSSKFATIYGAVGTNNYATLFVFRSYRDSTSDEIVLKVGFDSTETVGTNAKLTAADFVNAAGPIYRVVLSASSVLPEASRSAVRNGNQVYTLADPDVATYLEGSFAMEVRIYAEDPGPTFTYSKSLTELKDEVPVFTYNTAIVR